MEIIFCLLHCGAARGAMRLRIAGHSLLRLALAAGFTKALAAPARSFVERQVASGR